MPKIVNHAEYKADILKRCFELFARRGYNALTMREIAKELSISTGSLYHYFSSKQEIFREMLTDLAQRDVYDAVGQITPDQSLDERIDLLFDFIAEREDYFRNLLFLTVDYSRHEEIQTDDFNLGEITTYYKSAIREHTGLGEDSALSTFIFSLFSGLVTNRLLHPGSVDFKEQAQLTKAMVAGVFANLSGDAGG